MGSPHTIHEWRERDDAGVLHFHRAWRAQGKWHFLTTRKDDEEWQPLPSPDATFLRALRVKLHEKYLRRRVPWEQLLEIDALLGAAEKSDG